MATEEAYEIWKFPLQANRHAVLDMPTGARILCVQTQFGRPYVWALVDPSQTVGPRMLLTFGTGHPMGPEHATLPYVGPLQLDGGALVFHVFDRGEVTP